MLQDLDLPAVNFRKYIYELYAKARNLKGIYQKLTYKGNKF
jgi:hypothetical protein